MIDQSFLLIFRSFNLSKRFLVVVCWVSTSVSSLTAVLIQWSKCHQQLKRSWLFPIRSMALRKICCQAGSFSISWSSYIVTGSTSGSWTFGTGFDHSLELVVDVRYPWIGRFQSHLNNSCWWVKLTGDRTVGGIEIGEEFGMAEAGEAGEEV